MSAHEKRCRKKENDARDYAKHKEERLKKASEYYWATKEERKITNKAWREANKERQSKINRRRRVERGEEVRAARREHYRQNKPIYVANARKREKHIKIATPPWADLKAIEIFYIAANLQVIPAALNLRKGNAVVEATGMPLYCAWPAIPQFENHVGA